MVEKGHLFELECLLKTCKEIHQSDTEEALSKSTLSHLSNIVENTEAFLFFNDRDWDLFRDERKGEIAKISFTEAISKSEIFRNIESVSAELKITASQVSKDCFYQSFPCIGHEESCKFLLILKAINRGAFSDFEIYKIKAISMQLSMTYDLILKKITKETESKALHEIQLAGQIQRKMMPKKSLKLPNLEAVGWNVSCDETGGDFFDLQKLDDGDLIIALADVSGHGLRAALVMLEVRALFKAFCSKQASLPDILKNMNRILLTDLDDENFTTFFAGRFSKDIGTFRYASAGHEPPIIISSKNVCAYSLESTGTVLGFMEDIEVPLGDILIPDVGDIFVFATDGLYEAMNQNGKLYGRDRLISLFLSHVALSVEDLSQVLEKDLYEFCGNIGRRDDITVVIVKMVAPTN